MSKMVKFNATSMEIFPMDILINILARLPLKTLLCLKSVCKSWRSLITTRYFTNLHRYRNSLSSERLLIFVGEDHSLYSVSLDFIELPAIKIPFCSAWDKFSRRKSIVGSCNGLLLCLCDESSEFEALLINPSTLPYKRVPKLQVPQRCLYLSYGFGYDSINDDYKVVRIAHFLRKGTEVSIGLYSLRSDSWKLVVSIAPSLGTPLTHNGTLVNNHLLHWLVPYWGSINEHCIQCFDVCTEQWSEVALPAGLTSSGVRVIPRDIGVVDECLCLMAGDFDVWIMKEYGVQESWVKLFDFSEWIPIRTLKSTPIAYSKEGNEILLGRDVFTRAFWYEISTMRDRDAEFCCLPSYRQVSVCFRSLVSLCGN